MARRAELLNLNPVRDAGISSFRATGISTRDFLIFGRQLNLSIRQKLQQHAVENLRESIRAHGRPQTYNRLRLPSDTASETLVGAILRASNHEVTASKVRFMIDAEVRKRTPYYYVQEKGFDFRDAANQGRAPIGFFDGGHYVAASRGRYPIDAAKRGGGVVDVRVKVEGYHYSERAREDFDSNRDFDTLLAAAQASLRKKFPKIKFNVEYAHSRNG